MLISNSLVAVSQTRLSWTVLQVGVAALQHLNITDDRNRWLR